MPAGEVRAQLARLLKRVRLTRHDMHLAVHPDGESLCVFFRAKAQLTFLPVTIRNVPLALVVHATETESGLRIDEVHEWSADDPQAASRVVRDHHGWSAYTTLEPYLGFGAVS